MAEIQKDYRQFDLEDFVSDDHFMKWAKGKSDQDDPFWDNYIQANPQQQPIIMEAKAMVTSFSFEPQELEEHFFDRLNDRINLSIDADVAKELSLKKEKPNNKLAFSIAAGIAACLLLALTYVFYPRDIMITNGFAGTKQVVLPDSSVVLLNANSTLTYPEKWDQSNREVKLTGEGFFKIKHLVNQGKTAPFQVDINDLSLHVLGTSFNVINTPAKVEVILKTGRLKVTHHDQEVFMKPADRVIYDQKQHKLLVDQVSDTNYLDWTAHQFIFNDLSILQVADKLSSFFDITFHFEDESLKQEKLSGRLDLSNREETLHTLELLLNKKIAVNGKAVTISR